MEQATLKALEIVRELIKVFNTDEINLIGETIQSLNCLLSTANDEAKAILKGGKTRKI